MDFFVIASIGVKGATGPFEVSDYINVNVALVKTNQPYGKKCPS
jgi:hypothetical protein